MYVKPILDKWCKKHKLGYRKLPFNEDYFGLEYGIFDLEFPWHEEELRIHHFDKSSKLKEDMKKIRRNLKGD